MFENSNSHKTEKGKSRETSKLSNKFKSTYWILIIIQVFLYKKKLSFLLYCDKQKAIFLLQNKLLKISRDTNGCTITLHFTYNQLIILRKIIFCSNPYLVMCYFDVFTCTIVYPLSRRVLWAVTRTLKAIHDPRFLLVIFLLLCARIYETVAERKFFIMIFFFSFLLLQLFIKKKRHFFFILDLLQN